MRVWPRGLLARLACAFLVAVGALVGLSYAVDSFESGPRPTKRAAGPAAAPSQASRPTVAAAEAVDGGLLAANGRLLASAVADGSMATAASASPVRGGVGAVLRQLRPISGTILLAHRRGSLAPDIAPVVQILPSGELVLVRPEPRADRPLQPPALSRAGHGAGVVLPVRDLGALSPSARASLILLLQRWLVARPIPPETLQSSDVTLVAGGVRRLLSWVP